MAKRHHSSVLFEVVLAQDLACAVTLRRSMYRDVEKCSSCATDVGAASVGYSNGRQR